MAQDNRSIVITLKIDSSGENKNEVSNQTSGTKVSNNTDKSNTAKAVAAFAVAQVVQTVVSEGLAWAEYYWNRELNINDDYVGQRNKQIVTTQVNRLISSASKIGNAAIAGFTVGGPIGAVIGGVIGAFAEGAGMARSNQTNWDQQNIKIHQLAAQLDFTRSRAGWSTHAASIGEDL